MARTDLTATATATAALHAAATRPDARGAAPAAIGHEPGRLTDTGLVEQLVEHHAYARRALPYIVALLAKVAGSHRRRNAKLGVLCDAGQDLADALEAHLETGERELFPALLAGAAADGGSRRDAEGMCRRHRELALHLARIRWLADDFVAPPWGGRAYHVLMEELEALEENVLEHLHLESFVLVPRLSSRDAAPC